MLHSQVQTLRLELFSVKSLQICVRLITKQADSAFIAEQNLFLTSHTSSWSITVSSGISCDHGLAAGGVGRLHIVDGMVPRRIFALGPN